MNYYLIIIFNSLTKIKAKIYPYFPKKIKIKFHTHWIQEMKPFLNDINTSVKVCFTGVLLIVRLSEQQICIFMINSNSYCYFV